MEVNQRSHGAFFAWPGAWESTRGSDRFGSGALRAGSWPWARGRPTAAGCVPGAESSAGAATSTAAKKSKETGETFRNLGGQAPVWWTLGVYFATSFLWGIGFLGFLVAT